jgi:hypothetical protein
VISHFALAVVFLVNVFTSIIFDYIIKYNQNILYFIYLHSKDLKNILFASTTSLDGILNSEYKGTILSGEPNIPHNFLL